MCMVEELQDKFWGGERGVIREVAFVGPVQLYGAEV